MIGVGIIGLGTVGTGTYNILTESGALIKERTGLDIKIVRVAEKDQKKTRGKGLPAQMLTRDAQELIEDPNVQIVVELIGGLHPAQELITAALEKRKWVVTANKALLAEAGNSLFRTAALRGCEIGFEAAVCGGIPVIHAVRDGLVGNNIAYIMGILNGTSNYILTRMTEEEMPFEKALAEAQKMGFAEKDPTFDIGGIDAAHKLCILVRLAFSKPIEMKDIVTGGISKIQPIDIAFAREFGFKIKLLGIAREMEGSVEARVEPAMIPINHPMASVNGVFNAVYLIGDRVGPTLFYGKGAGSEPTGSAVVSDIVAMARRIESKEHPLPGNQIKTVKKVKLAQGSRVPYYMRFMAQDRPGVLSKVSGILGNYGISILAVNQRERKESGHVPIVMLTHEAGEKELRKAKEEIDRLPFIEGESVHIRIEEGNL